MTTTTDLTVTTLIPTCPGWCRSLAGHDDSADAPGDWARFHVAWAGEVTFRDCHNTSATLSVEVSGYESCDVVGEYVLSAPQTWIRDVDASSPLASHELRAFANLAGEAATTTQRITRGTTGVANTR